MLSSLSLNIRTLDYRNQVSSSFSEFPVSNFLSITLLTIDGKRVLSMEQRSATLKKCKVPPRRVGGGSVYGAVESIDHRCEADHPMRKKPKTSIEIVEVDHERTTKTIDLPVRSSSSRISNDSGKALRAAMLKTRFAETILNAQKQAIIFNNNDEVKKKIWERKKAETEADIKEAKVIFQKHMRKEREISGLALQNVKKTVEWNDDVEAEHEIEKVMSRRIAESIDNGGVTYPIMRKNAVETVGLLVRIDSRSKSSTGSNKVLRGALLKSRLAETTLKARQKVIAVNKDNKAEKERWERKTAETETNIKTAKMLLQKQSQKEREIARFAVENMKQAVFWNHAVQVEKEFENLIGMHTLYY